MTQPQDPGQPSSAPGPGAGYGPPPPRHPQRDRQPPRGETGPRPLPPPQGPARPEPVGPPPPGRGSGAFPVPEQPFAQRPAPPDKGLVGALFDANFNYLVTPKLIKLWYLVALLLITLQCAVVFGLGAWIATWDDFWAWGIILMVASPLVWLFELLLVRIFMEAVVVRFKGVEHLRVIKDKI